MEKRVEISPPFGHSSGKSHAGKRLTEQRTQSVNREAENKTHVQGKLRAQIEMSEEG